MANTGHMHCFTQQHEVVFEGLTLTYARKATCYENGSIDYRYTAVPYV